ncbi:uncharacterized protein LOC128177176 isoform X1 [Crassostrea angulata]|uniref:uncharacterized protein LOC128177176 isoform X1 n=1 Tax=Magallana angulata TaxID=2784310 RepID=UPI0022B0C9F3|nr:uncharacterized protein LOC128177176 isoform X1 [Crassostrea angulata]
MNAQVTISGISQNSNECDNPGNSDRMQKSLKESDGQPDCFVTHGKRLHNSTFRPQPVTSLISLSQIQKNILSHSDRKRRRLQYDNAWNILEKGDARLSNHNKPSVTTKQLNTSYVFVGSVQETSREVKAPPTHSSGLTDDSSRYSGDTEDYKSRSKVCSMKKICKYVLWILIILSITAVVAISAINYQNSQAKKLTNSMEAQIDDNNEINKTLGIVLDKFDAIKKSIESMKSLVEETNNNVKSRNDLTNQRSPVYSSGGSVSDSSDSGGQCKHTTNDGCVKDCRLMCNGDYQSCETCEGYVSCNSEYLTKRKCSNTDIILFWDDKLKACEHRSSTCIV